MEILEIELLTDNIEETSNFYFGLLGFEKVCADKKTISFKAGQSVLTFKQSNKVKPKYHFAFNIPCNKLEEAITWISSKVKLLPISIDSVIAHFNEWNAKAIYFYDSNGNILEFIARFDLNNLSHASFNASSIQSISEMGIVTDNPSTFANKIMTENELSVFSKDVPSDEFVALGNDNGLFIIVTTNRQWYPHTKLPAEKHYTKIRFRVNNLVKEITLYDTDVSLA